MKILISDFDNTLAFNGVVPQENLEAIKRFRESGNLFVVCTGRNIKVLGDILKADCFDILNISSGACVDYLGEQDIEYIDNNYSKQLVEFLKHYDTEYMAVCGMNFQTYSANSIKMHIRQFVKFHSLPKRHKTKNITAICIGGKNEEDALKTKKLLEERFPVTASVNHRFIDITSNKINKKIACDKIQKRYPDAKIYTIGDGLNDLEMLEAYTGACMNSGSERLKEKIVRHYDSVASYIEDIMNDVV